MMRRAAIVVTVSLLAGAVATQAQQAQPGPEHEALGFWIGEWRIEAEAKPNPLFPEGPYNATMTAEWFPGGFQVLCRYDWTGAMGPYAELNVMGYDQLKGEYFNYAIDGLGGNMVFTGPAQDNVFTYLSEFEAEGTHIAFRWTVTDVSPGVITWTSEVSMDGGEWILAGEAKGTRR
jgi:hypothetical protein